MEPKYRDTAHAFDTVAPHYDAVYGPQGNAVMTWMRQESLALLKATFPRGSYLLELGCGTGEEAIALAACGRRVLATDISPKMSALTQIKAQAAGLSDRVAAVAVPAANIGALQPPSPFDGSYASFGALNCEPRLQRLGAALAHLIRPGGAFVCSVMGRCCPFEMAWFILHGRPRAAFRRLHRGWQFAPVAGPKAAKGDRVDPISVLTRYLTVQDVGQAFFPAFVIERTLSLPLLLPPPYLDPLFKRHRKLFNALERLERQWRQRWPWRLWGDHVALVLRRGP